MGPRSRHFTTVGVLAAAASITSSEGASSVPNSCASWDCQSHNKAYTRIPRGGSSAESTSDAHKHKKKKRSKSEKKESADNNSTQQTTQPDDGDYENAQETILPPEISHILSTTCHYSVLSIPKTASQTEILKAYRKKCVLTHPDKLPKHVTDRRGAFDKVAKAFEVLSCEKKRAIYDKFGHADPQHPMGEGFFGQGANSDVFKDFFGSSAFFGDPFFGRRASADHTNGNPFRRPPRNKDLRYNLEVTLEDLYSGSTKHVAIQQPNALQPHFPLRKELEVTLTPGMMSGNSVRISGVVDSIPNCAPADVVFLLSERRHPVFTRRGCDLAMEIKISLGESVGGFTREVRCLDGKVVTIGPPKGEVLEKRVGIKKETNATVAVNETDTLDANATDAIYETETIQLPSTIIQTGDVHVLKGKGMPKLSTGGTQQYGDLYIQYVVEMPGGQTSNQKNNLSAEERVELARLLHRLEGKNSPRIESDNSTEVQYLELASASDFGKSPLPETPHDEHLHHHEDDDGFHNNDINDFFQRAFAGRSSFGNFGNGGFHYFSSGRGSEDHKVECNQM